ncbi:MAG: hypothetical protein M3R50_11325 [Bacteroidota bacterium]|nr:hypothetical protein [Bacteroidota bacterium]
MAVKNTIAIIASTKEKAKAIVQKIANKKCRILLVSKHENEYVELQAEVQSKYPAMELDTTDCMKDGCWEADVIIMNVNEDEEKEVSEMIREVATQKLVINFSDSEKGCSQENLQRLLSHSRVVRVSGSGNMEITGNDEGAIHTASALLKD